MARLTQLIARFGTGMPPNLVGGVTPIVTVVGSTRYVKLPAGVVGRIQMLRNGMIIVGAKSRGRVGDYLYKLQSLDNNAAITVQITDLIIETDGPRRFAIFVPENDTYSVLIEHDETLMSLPSGSAYSMGGVLKTAKSNPTVSLFAPGVIKLTYVTTFQREDRPRLTYVPPATNAVRDVLENLSAEFTNVLVVVQSPDPIPAFQRPGTGVAYVQGAGGWLSDASVSVLDAQSYSAEAIPEYLVPAVPSQSVALYQYLPGWIEMRVQDSLAIVRGIAISSGQSTRQTEFTYHARQSSGQVQAYSNNVLVGSAYVFPSPSLLCVVRVIRNRLGVIEMQTSEDDAQTWTTRHVFVNNSDALLQPRFYNYSRTVPIIGVALYNFRK